MIFAVMLLLLSVSMANHAADLFDLNFPVPLKISELAKIVYGEILSENYILEADLLKDETAISSNLRGLTKKTASLAFASVLQQQGYKAEKINGVNFIRKRKADDAFEIFHYRPKYRKTGYLVDLSSALFKEGSFTSRRSVQSPAVESLSTSTGALQDKKSDTGHTAQSAIDKDPDTLIFQGPQREIDLLKKILAQIDQPQGEITVKGIVYEVSTNKTDGSAYGLALNILGGRLGITAGIQKNLGNAITLHNAGSIGLDAVASALATDSRFKTLSSPNLRVKSGATARFSAGADVPILGAVQLQPNGTSVQSVSYKPSGVILSLMPEVRENQIDLTVNQQLSSFVATTTGVNNSPTLIKREITTSVTAKDEEFIILGGLTEEKNSQDSNGLAFIPEWLHSKSSDTSKTEILLILQVQKI